MKLDEDVSADEIAHDKSSTNTIYDASVLYIELITDAIEAPASVSSLDGCNPVNILTNVSPTMFCSWALPCILS